MSTQKSGSVCGSVFCAISRDLPCLPDDLKKKILKSRLNNSWIMETTPYDVTASYAGLELPRTGRFSYSREFTEWPDEDDEEVSYPRLNKIFRLLKNSRKLLHNQEASGRFLSMIDSIHVNDSILKQFSRADNLSDSILQLDPLNLATPQLQCSDMYVRCFIAENVILKAHSLKVQPSSEQAPLRVSSPVKLPFIIYRTRSLVIIFFPKTALFFDLPAAENLANMIGGLGKAYDAVRLQYPRLNVAEKMVSLLNDLFKLSDKAGGYYASFLGYILHQCVISDILGQGFVERDVTRQFLSEATEKIVSHQLSIQAEPPDDIAVIVERGVQQLLDGIQVSIPDYAVRYDVSAIFRIIPAADFSRAHILQACYKKTTSEHPLREGILDLYKAYMRSRIYKIASRMPADEITSLRLVSEEGDEVQKRDAWQMTLEEWKKLRIQGKMNCVPLQTDCFSASKDSSCPTKHGWRPESERPQESIVSTVAKNHFLESLYHDYYRNTTLEKNLVNVINRDPFHEMPLPSIDTNIQVQLKFESQKLPTNMRVFAEASSPLRFAFKAIELMSHTLLRYIPGNALGRNPLWNMKTMQFLGQDIPPSKRTIVSYDLSSFGTKYPTELLAAYLDVLSELSGIENLSSIMDIFHSGRLFYNSADFIGSYLFTSGNCEGFHNRSWTSEHCLTMAFTGEILRDTSFIIGRIHLMVFSDDGISSQSLPEAATTDSVNQLASEIAKGYAALGKSLNPLKMFISRHGFIFLNYVFFATRLLPSGVKTVAKLRIEKTDALQGPLEDMDSILASAKGAIERGAYVHVVYRELLRTYWAYAWRSCPGFANATLQEQYSFVLYPRQFFGMSLPSPYSLRGTLVKDSLTECMCQLLQVNQGFFQFNTLRTLSGPVGEKDFRRIVMDPAGCSMEGVGSYQAKKVNMLASAILLSRHTSSTLKAALGLVLNPDDYLSWLKECTVIAVEVLEKYAAACPLATMDAVISKMKTRTAYMTILSQKSFRRVLRAIAIYRKQWFRQFRRRLLPGNLIDPLTGADFGSRPAEYLSWTTAARLRLLANGRRMIVGTTEQACATLLVEAKDKRKAIRSQHCVEVTAPLMNRTDAFSERFQYSGFQEADCCFDPEHMVSVTSDPFEEATVESFVDSLQIRMGRSLKELAAISAYNQQVVHVLLENLKAWWNVEPEFVMDSIKHDVRYDTLKRYCISKSNKRTYLTALPQVAALVRTRFPHEIRTNESAIADFGRVRLIALNIYCERWIAHCTRGASMDRDSVFLVTEHAVRAIPRYQLEHQRLVFKNWPRRQHTDFTPFNLKMAMKTTYDPKLERPLTSGTVLMFEGHYAQHHEEIIMTRDHEVFDPQFLPVIAWKHSREIVDCISAEIYKKIEPFSPYAWTFNSRPSTRAVKFLTNEGNMIKRMIRSLLSGWNNEQVFTALSQLYGRPKNELEGVIYLDVVSQFESKDRWAHVAAALKEGKTQYWLDVAMPSDIKKKLTSLRRCYQDFQDVAREMARLWKSISICKFRGPLATTTSGKRFIGEVFVPNPHRLSGTAKKYYHSSSRISEGQEEAVFLQLMELETSHFQRKSEHRSIMFKSHKFNEARCYLLRKLIRVSSLVIASLLSDEEILHIQETKPPHTQLNPTLIARCVTSLIPFVYRCIDDWRNGVRDTLSFSDMKSIIDSATTKAKAMLFSIIPEGTQYASMSNYLMVMPRPLQSVTEEDMEHLRGNHPVRLTCSATLNFQLVALDITNGRPAMHEYFTRHITEAGYRVPATASSAGPPKRQEAGFPKKAVPKDLIEAVIHHDCEISNLPEVEANDQWNEFANKWRSLKNDVQMRLLSLVQEVYNDIDSIDEPVLSIEQENTRKETVTLIYEFVASAASYMQHSQESFAVTAGDETMAGQALADQLANLEAGYDEATMTTRSSLDGMDEVDQEMSQLADEDVDTPGPSARFFQ